MESSQVSVCSEPFNPPEQRSSDRDRVTVSVSRLIIEGEQVRHQGFVALEQQHRDLRQQ